MTKIRNFLIAVIAITALSTSAFAGSFGVGTTFSQTSVDASGTEVTETTETGDTSTRTASVDNKALIASFYGEYSTDSFSFTSEGNGFTIGLGITPGEADVSDAIHSRVDGYSAAATISNYQSVYVEIPVYGMLYVKAGQSKIDLNTNETNSVANGSYSDVSLDGKNYGVGIKGKFTDKVKWKAFYEKTDFDDISLTSSGNTTTGHKLTADLDTKSYGVSLGYVF